MPNTASAKKALRSSRRKRTINLRVIHAYKTAIREFLKNPITENLKTAYSKIDTASKKNVIHKNKAARLKSRLAKHLGIPTASAQE